VLQTCEAIAEAHALDIIHRDIKPQNLFLVEGRNSIKVLDFGISKQIAAEGTGFTGSNAIFGTLSYMSPEQMAQSKRVDARSDIWSIGVVLYELLTGKVPFPGKGILEIVTRVTSEVPSPPSLLRRELPVAIDAVVERCLQRDPARRFGSVIELAETLRSLGTVSSAVEAAPIVEQSRSPVVASLSEDANPLKSPSGDAQATELIKTTKATKATKATKRHRKNKPSHPKEVPVRGSSRSWRWALVSGGVGVVALAIVLFTESLPWAASAPRSGDLTRAHDLGAVVQQPEVVERKSASGEDAQLPSEPAYAMDPGASTHHSDETTQEESPGVSLPASDQVTHVSGSSVNVQRQDKVALQADQSSAIADRHRSSMNAQKGRSRLKARLPREGSPNGDPRTGVAGEASAEVPSDSSVTSMLTTGVAQPPGSSRVGVLADGVRSTCEARTDGTHPLWLDLSSFTREQRSQFTSTSITSLCLGDPANTHLCCQHAPLPPSSVK
jgi:Protein kinase domain